MYSIFSQHFNGHWTIYPGNVPWHLVIEKPGMNYRICYDLMKTLSENLN